MPVERADHFREPLSTVAIGCPYQKLHPLLARDAEDVAGHATEARNSGVNPYSGVNARRTLPDMPPKPAAPETT
jgi:hypothetical protein